MHFQTVYPWCTECLDIIQPADGIADRVDSHVLVVLVFDVFPIGGFEGFLPIAPFGVREPRTPANYWREDLLLADRGIVPIEFPGKMQPFFPFQHPRSPCPPGNPPQRIEVILSHTGGIIL